MLLAFPYAMMFYYSNRYEIGDRPIGHLANMALTAESGRELLIPRFEGSVSLLWIVPAGATETTSSWRSELAAIDGAVAERMERSWAEGRVARYVVRERAGASSQLSVAELRPGEAWEIFEAGATDVAQLLAASREAGTAQDASSSHATTSMSPPPAAAAVAPSTEPRLLITDHRGWVFSDLNLEQLRTERDGVMALISRLRLGGSLSQYRERMSATKTAKK